MKTSYIKLCVILLFSMTVWSCEKDEDQIVITTGDAPVLTASDSDFSFTIADSANQAVTFNWSLLESSWNQAEYSRELVSYTLQAATAGSNFKNPAEMNLGNVNSRSFKVSQFNSFLASAGLQPNVEGEIEMRIVASIASNITPTYSNVITISAFGYKDITKYPSVYVPGSFQGWKEKTPDSLSSVKNDKIYEGFLYFSEDETQFKITPGRSWDGAFGLVNGSTSGNVTTANISSSAGGNVVVSTGPGYYFLKANLNTNTLVATKTEWGIKGSAVGGGSTALTYDITSKTWSTTLNLVAGTFTFNANNGTEISYGDANNDLFLESGSNINITEAGEYTVVLNLNIPGNYRYSLTKK